MRTALRVVAGAIAVVAVTGPIGGQGKTDPALDKITAEFVAAFNAKDAAKVASFYTEDAALMPPNQPMVKGRTNIEAYWKDAFQLGLTQLQLRPVESAIAGSQAFEAGTATIGMSGGRGAAGGAGGSGRAVRETSKYVVIYKLTGAGWKMAYDIFNSDQPPAAPK